MGYRKRIKVAVACLCCTVISVNTLAKSKAERLYQLSLADLSKVEITSATGNSTPLDKAPATATVITSEEIEAMGARTLDEVLETVPGLHVSVSGLSRLEPIYSMRGIHTSFNPHILLLVNGTPVQFSVRGGRPVMFRYLTKNISRIEVIRGPGSAIYGADAYAGVINIITKAGGEAEVLELGARVGSYNMDDSWVKGGGSSLGWDYSYSLEYQHADGDDERVIPADLQTMLDGAFATNASLAPGPLATDYEAYSFSLGLNRKYLTSNFWVWVSNNSGVGPGAAQALDYSGGDDNNLYSYDLTYSSDDLFDTWNNSVRFTHQYYKTQARFTLLPAGTVVPIGSDGNIDFTATNYVQFPDGVKGNPGGVTKDTQLDFVSSFTGWDRHRLRAAVGVRRQSLNSRESKNFGPGVIDGSQSSVDGSLTDVSNTEFVFIQDTSRSTKYVSIQDEWRILADLELISGVRYDHYSDFGGTTNPRVALIWAIHEKITAKILYGSAFRAPAFSEQFNKNNPVSLGNPQLDPEEIDTYEAAFNMEVSDYLHSSISFFNYEAKGMIEFTPEGTGSVNRAQNIRNQHGRGLEWEIAWDATTSLRIKGNYSYVDAEDQANDSNIPDAPREQFTMNALFKLSSEWSINGLYNWVGHRSRLPGDVRPDIDSYDNLDITINYKSEGKGLGAKFGLRNALDKTQREPSPAVIENDYPLESRNAWLEISYRF